MNTNMNVFISKCIGNARATITVAIKIPITSKNRLCLTYRHSVMHLQPQLEMRYRTELLLLAVD